MRNTTGNPVTAGVLVLGTLAAFVPAAAFAQGKSNQAHGHASPPSQSVLPSGSVVAPTSGAAPLAWMDDANLIDAGAVSFSMYASRWSGAGASEANIPVFDMGLGVTDRFQFTATVPRIAGDDAAGVTGTLGTTYFSGKYAAYKNDGLNLRVALAPTLEVLGTRARASLAAGDTRAQFGLPVSVQIDRDGRRFYASSGWFSRGIWFAGAGAGMQVKPRIAVSASFSHSWTTGAVDPATGVARDRSEISGGAAFAATRHVSVFGSIGRTVATLDENGAGTTVAAGVSLYVSPPRPPSRAPHRP